jgi:hypothetical protein
VRFPNPFLRSFLGPTFHQNEVAAVDSSGGGDVEPSGDVPDLDEGDGGEPLEQDGDDSQRRARSDERDEQGRFKPKAGEPAKPAPAPQKRKYALKTKTGVVEEELSDDDVVQRLTRDRDSYSRYEQAAAMRKEAEAKEKAFDARVQSLLSDPKALRSFLREKSGDKAHDLLVHALKEELAERNRDPRDVELERYKRAEAEAKEKAEREAEEASQREAKEALDKHVQQNLPGLQKRVFEALEKVGLPGDDRLARVVAYHYLRAQKDGIELSTEDLARVAGDELDRDLGVRTKGLTGAQVKQRYPDLYRAVHADLVAQLKGRRPGANAAVGADPLRESPTPRPSTAPAAKKHMSAADWRNL